MSTESVAQTVDQNAQAAEDAKKMLAELQNDAGKDTGASSEVKPAEKSEEASEDRSSRDFGRSRSDRRDGDRRGNDSRGRGRGGRGGGGGRGRGGSDKWDHVNHKNNIKSDLTSQEVTDDPVAIRKQVEFYFSDSNLPMDKFLLGKVGGSQNNPVDLTVIHSFKRMRRFQPFEAIVKALKESTVLELTDDDTCVKRKEPLPEALNDGPNPVAVQVFEDKAMPRSVYAKGFGDEVPSTQFDIEAFFAPYGPTNAIRLRRTEEKIFKRSVFVEFETEELAKKFLELDPMPKFKDKELLVMSKKEYCDKKVEDIKSGKIKANNRNSDGRGSQDFKRRRGEDDNRDWRERREQDRKNGFRDDKRRSGREMRTRHDAEPQGEKATNGDSEKTDRDAAKAEALAKARAVVEQEAKKDEQTAADSAEQAEQGDASKLKTDAVEAVAESIKADSEAVTKKRSREEDDAGDAERDSKKVDTKSGA